MIIIPHSHCDSCFSVAEWNRFIKDVYKLNCGGAPGIVVKAACFESRTSRVRAPIWPLSFKATKCFLPHSLVKNTIVGSLCDREVACLASERQSSIFASCVWRAVSSHSSHHPQEAFLAQFSLYVHKDDLKPH